MSLIYRCDGPGCPAKGEPRGPAKHKPEGWQCAIVDDRMVDLCATCATKLRREREASKCSAFAPTKGDHAVIKEERTDE